VNSQATPIVIDGVMYLPAANRVVALEAETGKEIWQYPVTSGAPSRRGVAYWPGEANMSPRILFMAGRRLIALEARSGVIAAGFGTKGEVDIEVPYNSVPGIFRNVVIVGANTPPGTIGGIGNARAFDVRTGRQAVGIQFCAQPGSVGH
jgi:quinoprotein glucose dehydrogenase